MAIDYTDETLTEVDVLIGGSGFVKVFCGDYQDYGEVVTITDDNNENWVSTSRDEAIAAARAILKHFGEE